ncbi:esterase [Actinotalea ferrariae CF5-4]|uniref:Esterase n=1 Tax=Actinotalea ferrariae CF5-4 TaxID=948458 RepID=A0A021VMT1_9CELL|nr:patatin-like phospholipase family protein [Actinotalea ferrariae]EYR62524.1 esterase [Actinotalea ferrariae CF5-4]
MAGPPRVALALGSGGARGYAHIGAIEEVAGRGYEVVDIAGASMGALVGGVYAAGALEPYTAWARSLTQREVLRLLDPSLGAPGAIRAEKILAKVSELLDGAQIEDLPISFTAVATDLLARKEVWFQRGPVDAAIRASIALPTVITPVMINGRLLADGALMNPIPVSATTASQADVTIAVSVSGELPVHNGKVPTRESAAEQPVAEWGDRLRRTAARLVDTDLRRTVVRFLGTARARAVSARGGGTDVAEALTDRIFEELPPGLRTLDVVELSLDAMQSVVASFRLAGYPPDVLVAIPKNSCNTLEFHRAAEMIDLGRSATAAALDQAVAQGVLPAVTRGSALTRTGGAETS